MAPLAAGGGGDSALVAGLPESVQLRLAEYKRHPGPEQERALAQELVDLSARDFGWACPAAGPLADGQFGTLAWQASVVMGRIRCLDTVLPAGGYKSRLLTLQTRCLLQDRQKVGVINQLGSRFSIQDLTQIAVLSGRLVAVAVLERYLGKMTVYDVLDVARAHPWPVIEVLERFQAVLSGLESVPPAHPGLESLWRTVRTACVFLAPGEGPQVMATYTLLQLVRHPQLAAVILESRAGQEADMTRAALLYQLLKCHPEWMNRERLQAVLSVPVWGAALVRSHTQKVVDCLGLRAFARMVTGWPRGQAIMIARRMPQLMMAVAAAQEGDEKRASLLLPWAKPVGDSRAATNAVCGSGMEEAASASACSQGHEALSEGAQALPSCDQGQPGDQPS